MTTYGPKIAHQGGSECPCDPEAKGRVWYDNGDILDMSIMGKCVWERVLVYRLAVEPVRETVEQECWAYRHNNATRLALNYAPGWADCIPVRVTTNLEDGKPISGSWEAIDDY